MSPLKKPCRQLRREKHQSEGNKNSAGKNISNNGGQTNYNHDNKMANIISATNTNKRNDKKTDNCLATFWALWQNQLCNKGNAILEPMQPLDGLLANKRSKEQSQN